MSVTWIIVIIVVIVVIIGCILGCMNYGKSGRELTMSEHRRPQPPPQFTPRRIDTPVTETAGESPSTSGSDEYFQQ
jgi:hypothetical protein